MGVLKIKTEDGWSAIEELNLTSLKINNQNIEEKIQNIADNAAVSIYIEVYSKQFDENIRYKSDSVPSSSTEGYSSIADWFNTLDNKEKAKKGFLIEHRTIDTAVYHLPYYWNGSAWTLLNAIWG